MNFHPYLRLTRFDKPAGGLLLLWPTMWGLWLAAEGTPDWHWLVIFIGGVWAMRAFGCVVNDMADSHLDAQVTRTRSRPLAAKVISKKQAGIVGLCCLLVAFVLWWMLPPLAKWWAIAALMVAVCYPFAKRVMPIPQVVLSIAFSFGIMVAFAAVREQMPPPEAWGFVLANMLWVLGYDTIYAMCDREDDIGAGIKSSALWLGRYDVTFVGLCYVFTIILLSGLGIWLFPSAIAYQVSLLFALLVLMRCWFLCRHRHPQQCFLSFSLNHWFGAFVWLGIVAVYV